MLSKVMLRRSLGFLFVLAGAAALWVMFASSGSGRDSFGSFGSGGSGYSGSGYTGYKGFYGSKYSGGWKDALEDGGDILQDKIDSFNRAQQHIDFAKWKSWGGPSNECTSKETWTQRCGYHR